MNISSSHIVSNNHISLTDRINQQGWLKNLLRLLAVTMGAVHTWAAAMSHSMNPDGINYLDMGEAYLRGDWAMALNSMWSPLYSWVLGVVMRVFQPGMEWEFPVVHITNFFIFLAALVSFEFFLRQLIDRLRKNSHENLDEAEEQIPEWVMIGVGYSLFAWSALVLIKVWSVNPDMLVAVIVYLVAGLILRIQNGHDSWKMFALLGVLLGAGFLAKAIMLPVGMIFLAAAFLFRRDIQTAIPRYFLSLSLFALICLSFTGAVSMVKGRLAYGDAGLLTYLIQVNGISYPHWQGEIPGFGSPVHPSRKILDSPPVYEFGTPVGGTYPISYDPYYWYEGVIPSSGLKDISKVLGTNGIYYFDLFLRQQAALVFGFVIFYVTMSWSRPKLKEILSSFSLLIPAIAALLIYAFVYVEGRYIAPFIVLLWMSMLAGVRLRTSFEARRFTYAVGGVMILFILGNLLSYNLEKLEAFNARMNVQEVSQASSPPSWPGEVARGLHDLGIGPGTKVGVIGYAFDSYWARLARVQIVAEMFSWEAYPYWLGDQATQAEVIDAFRYAGVQAIVAEDVPNYISPSGWERVGESSYYIYLIKQ